MNDELRSAILRLVNDAERLAERCLTSTDLSAEDVGEHLECALYHLREAQGLAGIGEKVYA